MVQSGSFQPATPLDVEIEVYVNGFLRKAESVDFAGDTSGGLPDQVVSVGTGMLSRTGTITWATQGAVESNPPHPIRRSGGWPPREGDLLEIDAIIDGVRFRRFTGRLGKVTGSLSSGTLQSDITDTLGDRLSDLVNIYPRLTGSQGQSYRVAWEALEQAGLGLLPQPDEGQGTTILHSTPQGDSWATIGSVASTSGATSTRDLNAGLALWTGLYSQVEDVSRLGNSILLIARGSTVQDSDVKLRLTDGTLLRLNHQYATGKMQMYVDGVKVHDTSWNESGVPVLAFGISFGWVHIWTTRTTKDTVQTASLPSKAREAWGTRTAGIHVRYVDNLDGSADDIVKTTPAKPAALRLPTISYQRLPATRGYENVTAKSVIESWGDSVLASVWMDEFGQTEVCSRAEMLARPTVRNVRVSERVFSGSWALGEDSVFSTVVVVGEQGVIRAPAQQDYRVTVYEEQSARGFDVPLVNDERFIEADPEVDWGPIDLIPSIAGAGGGGGSTGLTHGTWSSAAVSFEIDGRIEEGWPWLHGITYTLAIERLGQRTLKLTEKISGSFGGNTVFLKIPADGTAYQKWRNRAMPIIRALWTSSWARYTRRAKAGPVFAPTLDHDVGWWLTPSDGQKLANSLASEVATPMATLSQVSTLWDPRRQIGDIERWVAQDSDGNDCWTARVLVVGYREAWEGRVPTQSVDVRIISMEDVKVEPPFVPAWGYVSQALFDPKGPQSSLWGNAVAELERVPVTLPSDWGRQVKLLAAPLTPPVVPSPWGSAPSTLVEPHRPIGVWDGTRVRYTDIEVETE